MSRNLRRGAEHKICNSAMYFIGNRLMNLKMDDFAIWPCNSKTVSDIFMKF